MILRQSFLILHVKVLLLKKVLELDKSIKFRFLRKDVLIKSFNIIADFVEEEVDDGQVIEDEFFGFENFFVAYLNKFALLDDFFEGFFSKLFFVDDGLIKIFQAFHDGGHNFFFLN